jgi:hypothetical protein
MRLKQELAMHAGNYLSGLDAMVIMIPIIGLMAAEMFGLHERFSSPRRSVPQRHKFCEIRGDGRSRFSDPDGRVFNVRENCT